jgi:hypothetical protein
VFGPHRASAFVCVEHSGLLQLDRIARREGRELSHVQARARLSTGAKSAGWLALPSSLREVVCRSQASGLRSGNHQRSLFPVVVSDEEYARWFSV